MSIAAVAARIAGIEARFGVAQPPVPTSSAPCTASSTFAAELSRANNRPAGDSAPAAAAPTADNVVNLARRYLGVPYVWGGTDPAKGLDCSGLVQLVFRQVGIELPRVSGDQARAGAPVDGLANARPGDVLAFGNPVDHVGIYLGGGKMIHAPRTGKDVEVSDVYETLTAIRRILPTADVPSVSVSASASGSAVLPAGTPYAAEFRRAEAATGVPARVLAAVAKAESGFDANAVSPAGARGLMQFMPATAAELGVNPYDPASAIDGAARLLKSHLQEFGSLPLALAAYNAGPGAVRKYGGVPPYAETQAYVQKIMSDLGSAA